MFGVFLILLTIMMPFLEKNKQDWNYISIIACKMPQNFFDLFLCAKRKICSWENDAEFRSALFRVLWIIRELLCPEWGWLGELSHQLKLTPSTCSQKIILFYQNSLFWVVFHNMHYILQKWESLMSICFHYRFAHEALSCHVNIKNPPKNQTRKKILKKVKI